MRKMHLFLVAVLLLAAKGFSFDEDRQGFILGIGAGLHSTTLAVELDGDEIGDLSYNGLATSFKIGGGVSPQLMLYYVANVSWFSDEYEDKDITITTGIAGFGMTYYFEDSAPSPYINGIVGIGSRTTPFESELEDDYGVGLSFGLGYEFTDHLSIEANFLYNNIELDTGDSLYDAYLITKSFQIYLSYLFY